MFKIKIDADFLLEQIKNKKKIAIVGNVFSGKKNLIMQTMNKLDKNNVLYINRKTINDMDNKIILPNTIIENDNNIFLDILYQLIVFDYSLSMNNFELFNNCGKLQCSIVATFQPFLNYDWDNLLKEEGFNIVINMDKKKYIPTLV